MHVRIIARSLASAVRNNHLTVYLPDISLPDTEPQVQVPYLPDFWDSRPTRLQQPSDPPLPKLVLITGADTHHGGGPSHNLHDEHREMGRITDSHVVPPDSNASIAQTAQASGLLQDIAHDLGIPPSFGVTARVAHQPSEKYRWQSRALDKDDVRGVWLLLGLLTGSWMAAGMLAPTA